MSCFPILFIAALFVSHNLGKGFSDHICGRNKGKEERNIGTLTAIGERIHKKDVTSTVKGCGSEYRLCLG